MIMRLPLLFKRDGDMSKSLKQFLFFGYASIIAFNLYSSKAGEQFELIFLYLRVFFPLCVFMGYNNYISNDNSSGKDFLEVLGLIVFVISIPALIMTAGIAVYLPYFWIGGIYRGLGVPPNLNFYLTLITPFILLFPIVLFFKNIKNK